MTPAIWFVVIVYVACVIGGRLADEDTQEENSRKRMIADFIGRNVTDIPAAVKDGEEGGDAAPMQANFSPWTKWSRCTRRCRQRRRRRCVRPSACGTSMLTEERACFGGRCNADSLAKPEKTARKARNKGKQQEDEFRILHHVSSSPYGEWSEWGPCSSSSCITRRSRACIMPEVCGKKVLEESAICYEEGSECERMHRKKRKRKKSDTGGGSAALHPLDEGKCGVSPLSSSATIPDLWNKLRIIGGREAMKGSWPWQLTILNKFREPFCGGTLLAPGWVLTAAHCLRRRLLVRSGEHSLMSSEGTEQESAVAAQHPHPDYDPDTVSNDIALLRLRKPFRLDDHTRPVCLPDGDGGVGESGMILGWGKRKSTAVYGTDHLHQAEVPVVPLSECRTSYGTFPLNDRMLCAGYKAGRVDSCAGDSGGPLLSRRRSDDAWTVFGVTSFGDGCGQKGKFGIYTDVSKYVKWIRRTISRFSR